MKKKIISFMLILLAAILVLYFSLKDDYNTIINTILNINKIYLIVAFILLFLYYFLRSLCIYIISKNFKSDYKMKNAIRMVLETNFFHAITPFATGGQPYEVYSLNKSGIKVADAISISVGNFITYQVALVSLGLIAIISNMLFKIIEASLLKGLIILGFIINFLVIVFLLWISISKKTDKNILYVLIDILGKLKLIKNPQQKKEKLKVYLTDFNKGSELLFKNKQKMLLLIIYHLVSLLLLYLIPYALFMGVGINVKIVDVVVIMSYVMLIGSFVPIPGGTGGLEYGFVIFFTKYIVSSKVNAMMLVWRFITYYFGLILGSIVLNIKKESKE
ncbi:MAG: flippase-like domain-containing protein [Bacilli bacterium]|nr:flippase-like domain-containing protein [Bacilli bacterium]